MSDTTRRSALKLMTAGVVAASLAPLKAFAQKIWWKTTPDMDAMTAIRTRRSVRSYTEEEVTDEQVKELLGAAMSAPSAGNEQPWEFILIRDKETLGKVGKINNFAAYARSAPLAILVCGNLDYDKYHGYWFEDVSARNAESSAGRACHGTRRRLDRLLSQGRSRQGLSRTGGSARERGTSFPCGCGASQKDP